MRISGITIPENKHLDIALTVIYGVGKSKSRNILDRVGVDYSKKIKDLSKEEENDIRKIVEENKIEGDLRREVDRNIKRLKDIKTLRGYRHSVALPVRGQRTKTNARTRKGPRRTMGSGRVSLQKK